jgi:hypothetical protein
VKNSFAVYKFLCIYVHPGGIRTYDLLEDATTTVPRRQRPEFLFVFFQAQKPIEDKLLEQCVREFFRQKLAAAARCPERRVARSIYVSSTYSFL